jgi:hypothetical protein
MRIRSESWFCFWSFLGLGAWGLAVSAVLFNYVLAESSGLLLSTILGLGVAGGPVAAYGLYKIKRGYEPFSFWVFLFGWLCAGVYSVFFGSVLQFLLLVAGVKSIGGVPIDHLFWSFPANLGGH